jgi:hypothetical protein
VFVGRGLKKIFRLAVARTAKTQEFFAPTARRPKGAGLANDY